MVTRKRWFVVAARRIARGSGVDQVEGVERVDGVDGVDEVDDEAVCPGPRRRVGTGDQPRGRPVRGEGAARRLVALWLPLALLHLGCDEKRPPKPPPPLPIPVIVVEPEVDARPAPKGLGPFSRIREHFKRDCPPTLPRHDGLIQVRDPKTGKFDPRFGEGITVEDTSLHCMITRDGVQFQLRFQHPRGGRSNNPYEDIGPAIDKVLRTIEFAPNARPEGACAAMFADVARYAAELLELPAPIERRLERLIVLRAQDPDGGSPVRVTVDSRSMCVEAGDYDDNCVVILTDCSYEAQASITVKDVDLPVLVGGE